MQIDVSQIKQGQLANFIIDTSSGATSGNIGAYVAQNGWLGHNVVYASGRDQTISGTKVFLVNPILNYSGVPNSAINRQAVLDLTSGSILSYSGFVVNNYIGINGNYTINDIKTFTGELRVAFPNNITSATPKYYVDNISGFLLNLITNITPSNVVFTTGAQTLSGIKIFDESPLVPIPTNPMGAVPLSMLTGLTILNTVFTSGDQTISGTKTYTQPPIVPLATAPNHAVPKQQVDALFAAVSVGNTGAFAGVSSINGESGASGSVYLQGVGTVTIYQCAEIFYISGHTAENTQLYAAQIPLPQGITGITYSFPSGFLGTPVVIGSLKVSGISGQYINSYIYGESVSGFGVSFSQAIPTNNNYFYSFYAIPTATGNSGFLGIQGQRGNNGRSPNARGFWRVGVMYSPLDYVFASGGTSYIATQTHNSDNSNRPGSTGNGFWQIFSSGTIGPTGYWEYVGEFDLTGTYFQKQSVTYDDSTWGYTGTVPASGIVPQNNFSGWKLLAKKGGIGSFINSGIITGVFTNISFYLSPVGTGLDLAESFCGYGFNVTGFALGAVQSGLGYFAGRGPLTGRLYARDLDNSKHVFQMFTFDRGLYSFISGDLSYQITGTQRLGVDITNSLSGLDKFSVGVFGFGF